jgi:hypothetical protein
VANRFIEDLDHASAMASVEQRCRRAVRDRSIWKAVRVSSYQWDRKLLPFSGPGGSNELVTVELRFVERPTAFAVPFEHLPKPVIPHVV